METPTERTHLLPRGSSSSSLFQSVFVRRLVLLGLIFLAICTTTLRFSPSDRLRNVKVISSHIARADPPAILAVGDWGRCGLFAQRDVAAALARVADGERNVRIVSTGDNFYENGVKSPSDAQFNSSYEHVYNVHDALNTVPFWPVLGNHDHFGDALAQISYSTRSAPWDMPDRFYARSVHPNLLLVFLDTTPYMHGGDTAGIMARSNGFHGKPQTEWLRKTLKAAKETHFLVIGHHNMYSGSTAGHRGCRDVRKKLEPVLKEYGDRVLAYVSGHEHALMHLHVNGIHHFISGGGSELDKVMLLSKKHNRDHWRRVWGVVRGKEAPFVKSLNGFFKFQFFPDRGIFQTIVYDAEGEVAYQHRKRVEPVPYQHD